MLQGPSVLLGSHTLLRRGDLCGTCNHLAWVLLDTNCSCSLLLAELHKPKCRTRKVLFCLTDMTKLELNYNYKTSTAKDDVKLLEWCEIAGIARKFRELVISVCEGGHLSVHLPKKWISYCNNEKRVSTNILSISYFCFDSYFPDFKPVSATLSAAEQKW